MRDYSNMPKLQWSGDVATMAKIKTQVMREEPVILIMPPGFDFSLDVGDFYCREESGRQTYCDANAVLPMLAEQNDMFELQEIAYAASVAGQVVDIDSAGGRLVIHD